MARLVRVQVQRKGSLDALTDCLFCRPDELAEKGVWAVGAGLELRVVLSADHERVVGNFSGLHQVPIGRETA